MESVAIFLTQVHVESSAMENTRLLPSLSAASLLILSLNSNATVLVYEDFNYTASTGIPTGTLNGGIVSVPKSTPYQSAADCASSPGCPNHAQLHPVG